MRKGFLRGLAWRRLFAARCRRKAPAKRTPRLHPATGFHLFRNALAWFQGCRPTALICLSATVWGILTLQGCRLAAPTLARKLHLDMTPMRRSSLAKRGGIVLDPVATDSEGSQLAGSSDAIAETSGSRRVMPCPGRFRRGRAPVRRHTLEAPWGRDTHVQSAVPRRHHRLPKEISA